MLLDVVVILLSFAMEGDIMDFLPVACVLIE